MSWQPDICLYHFPCDDGFGAAWAVARKWPQVHLVPTNYGRPFPDIDIAGKNLLIADFSYKPDVLAGLAEKANQIVILDHHKTAEADLEGTPRVVGGSCENVERLFAKMSGPGMNVLAEFDMKRSGAMLAWLFAFPGDKPPTLIRHIQDRDLRRMELPNARAISLLLRSYDYDMAAWNHLASALDDTPTAMLAEAKAIERYYDRRIAEMAPTFTLKTIGQWDNVPVAHASFAFVSDLAHELLQRHPEAPFAAVVVDAYGERTYSLRSEDHRQDVSEVARAFGGGGHRNAAGFRVPA